MISKELLGEVLGLYEVYSIYDVNDDIAPEFNSNSEIAFEYFGKEEDIDIDEDYDCSSNMQDMVINIYELAHKCKEWARDSFSKEITSHSGADKFNNKSFAFINFKANLLNLNEAIKGAKEEWAVSFECRKEAGSEPEAIFNACQWILDNKE